MTCYKYIKRCITLMISNGMICLVWLQIKLEDTHWSYPKRGVILLNGYIHFHFVLWICGIACHRKQFLQEQLTLLGHIWMIQIGMWKNSIQRSAQLSILKVYVYFIREESTEVACRLNFPLKDKGTKVDQIILSLRKPYLSFYIYLLLIWRFMFIFLCCFLTTERPLVQNHESATVLEALEIQLILMCMCR